MLPYEQQLVRKPEPGASAPAGSPEGAPAAAPSEHAVGPAETATANATPKPDAKASAGASPNAQPPSAGVGQATPPAEHANAADGSAMTPEAGADPSEAAPDDGARPYDDGQRPYDVTAAPPGAGPQGGAYGDPPQGAYAAPPPPLRTIASGWAVQRASSRARRLWRSTTASAVWRASAAGALRRCTAGGLRRCLSRPYGQAPDGAPQGGPQEEWVIVLASGAGMRATAADEAPMLFAFPYGRNLRVVSHYPGLGRGDRSEKCRDRLDERGRGVANRATRSAAAADRGL